MRWRIRGTSRVGERVHNNRAWSREDTPGVVRKRGRTETDQREEGETLTALHRWILSRHLPARKLSLSLACTLLGSLLYPVLSRSGLRLCQHISLPSSGSPRSPPRHSLPCTLITSAASLYLYPPIPKDLLPMLLVLHSSTYHPAPPARVIFPV